MAIYQGRALSGERLTFERVRYHRNGVHGEGFYSLEFVKHRGGGDKVDRDMIGVVFPREDDSGELEPTHYSVLDRGNPALRWRGDHFLDAMREAIKAAGDSVFRSVDEEMA